MRLLLAQYGTSEALVVAAERAAAEGFAVHDALTPFHVPALDAIICAPAQRLRGIMAFAGFGMACLTFLVETWTTVEAYPLNSGGRPLFSWPVFLLVPFEVGVLAAGIAGFVTFLYRCGFPRLHDPIFEIGDIERASQDRFFLAFPYPADDQRARLENVLLASGALSIAETRP